jgi:nucleotide-binding universal stress UspA family protein
VYKSIVVGTDGSETAAKAVETAAALARSSGATLHIVSAARLPSAAMLGADVAGMAAGWSGDDAELIKKEVEQILATAATSADGVPVETYTEFNDPAEALLDIATRVNADLIVVGNRGMTGRGRFLLGTVPNKISHHAPCSLLIVKTT